MPATTSMCQNPAILIRRRALIWVAAVLAIFVAVTTLFDKQPREHTSLAPLRVDVNTAPQGVLEALPRIGPALAGRIVEAREESFFLSLDDLDRRVRGIGPATIAGLRPYLRFD